MKKYISIDKNNSLNANYIELSAYYTKGGINAFTGQEITRGYYISATPVNRCGNCISFVGFTGACALLEEASRYSQRKMDNISNALLTTVNNDDIMSEGNTAARLINRVLTNNKLALS